MEVVVENCFEWLIDVSAFVITSVERMAVHAFVMVVVVGQEEQMRLSMVKMSRYCYCHYCRNQNQMV